jgi:rRNA-processing protein FCF1
MGRGRKGSKDRGRVSIEDELSSIVPSPLAECFITSQIIKRFEAMAENATQRLAQKQFSCKQTKARRVCRRAVPLF